MEMTRREKQSDALIGRLSVISCNIQRPRAHATNLYFSHDYMMRQRLLYTPQTRQSAVSIAQRECCGTYTSTLALHG